MSKYDIYLNKTIETYDCFYFNPKKIKIKDDLNESYKKLNNIIFCVDYIINKFNNKYTLNTEIKEIIDLYEKFSRINNDNKIKINKINILNTYNKYINNSTFIEIYKNNNISIEYLNLLKETESGVKYLNKAIGKFKTGGDSLNYDIQIYIDTLNSFCSQQPMPFNKYITTNDLLNNIRYSAQFNNRDILIDFITSNMATSTYNFNIEYYDYDIDRYDIHKKPNKSRFSRQCDYCEYNKDIILSYENLQQIYQNNLQSYIIQQNMYLETLTQAQKNIVNDYTRPITFNFLNAYISNPTPGFKQRYLTKWGITDFKHKFGNSFCDIICAYIPNSDYIKNKGYRDNADPLYDGITEAQWHIILQCYLTELNRIILGAPETSEPLLFFRGSTSDYIVHNEYYTDMSGNVTNVFLTNSRPSSVSFNFDASLFFYNQGSNPDKTMYRILVAPKCKLLFVTPLAHDSLKNEKEFLLPLHHVFTSYNLFTRIPAYNNFNNKNNICLNSADILNSKDIVLLPI